MGFTSAPKSTLRKREGGSTGGGVAPRECQHTWSWLQLKEANGEICLPVANDSITIGLRSRSGPVPSFQSARADRPHQDGGTLRNPSQTGRRSPHHLRSSDATLRVLPLHPVRRCPALDRRLPLQI